MSEHLQGSSGGVSEHYREGRESMPSPQTQPQQVQSDRFRVGREHVLSPQNQIDRSRVGRETMASPLVQSNFMHGVTGRVPDRFHAGRESLSVIRNVTVCESKRPKAKSQDHEYKRRFSTSGPIPDDLYVHCDPVISPVGRNLNQLQSTHKHGYPSPECSFPSPPSPRTVPTDQQRHDPTGSGVRERGKESGRLHSPP